MIRPITSTTFGRRASCSRDSRSSTTRGTSVSISVQRDRQSAVRQQCVRGGDGVLNLVGKGPSIRFGKGAVGSAILPPDRTLVMAGTPDDNGTFLRTPGSGKFSWTATVP